MSDFSSLAQTLGSNLLKGALGGGRRFLQQKTVDFFVHAIGAIRSLLFLQYVVMATCFLWAMSFFAGAFAICQRWDQSGSLEWTMTLKFCLGIWAFSSLVLYFSVRKRTWTSAAQVEKRVAQFFNSNIYEGSASRAEISALVSEILDERIEAAMTARLKSVPMTDQMKAS